MNPIVWSITNVQTRTLGDLTRVVDMVKFKLTCTQESPVQGAKPLVKTLEHSIQLPAPSEGAKFIAYADLDMPTVLGWSKDLLNKDGRVEAWEQELRDGLDADIAAAALNVESPALPWDAAK